MVREQTRYSRLAHITKIINTKLDLHEVLMHVTKAISEEIVKCSAVGIYLPQEDGTFRGFAGKPEKINGVTLDMLVIDPKKDRLAKELIETKKTIYIPDTSKDDRPDPEPIKAFNIQSLLALPIAHKEELFGLIFLFDYGTPMSLSDLEIQNVEAYVNMAAVAIQNANILNEKESLIIENQLLLGVSRELSHCVTIEDSLQTCFSYLGKVLGENNEYVACLVDSPDKKSFRIKTVTATEPALLEKLQKDQGCNEIIKEVIQTKNLLYIPDIYKENRLNHDICRYLDINSLLLIPFVSMGKVIGAIAVGNKEKREQKYYDCHLQIAQSIVDATAPVFLNLQYVGQLKSMVEERTEELADANERLTSVIEGITGGFFALDEEWRFTYVNKHQLLPENKTVEEVLGKNIWEVYPDLIDTVFYNELHKVMSERTPLQFAVPSVYGDTWHEVVAYPYVEGICCLLKDITEKKKYEKELKRLSSLDLIGQMAAGISHEVRNPMTTVRGFLQLLLMENGYEKHRHYFEVMIEELDRVNSIITEFLSMGNTKTSDLQMLDLNTIIFDMAPLMEIDAVTQNKSIEVVTEDVPKLLLNHNEVRQLLINMYRNGLEAMDEGESLTIRTYTEADDVVLAVQDRGKGIRPEIMEKLGTPFFTTKDNGTGLGLGVCYAIAARHNAEIEIETGAEGTTFYIIFKIGQRFD
ncbi:GAF domain-containing protein [Siminovitchia acidinfaciens]|uniref:histidine kinase n=1 Tax=Siminovitchia acidinfaciens TaxID=2321395 RepID=A0A429XV15_9BACI|nr:GAF domain-containing protein [Siminovitchia acidinfaciens]RST72027.1 GAF domain-containing protein [Siminovitchia acidinfaciens]